MRFTHARIVAFCHSFILDPSLLIAQSTSASAAAPVAVTGQSGAFTYLFGIGWQGQRRTRDLIKFEYVNQTRWGDNYVYLEMNNLATWRPPNAADPPLTGSYAEWHPRIRLGGPRRDGFLRSVSTAHEVNVASGFLAHLHGVGFDWRMPGLVFFVTNAYLRDNIMLPGTTWQVLVTGESRRRIAGRELMVGGFVDFIGAEASRRFQIASHAQIGVDVGNPWLGGGSRLYVGLEVLTWINQGGAAGPDQRVPEIMVKWAF